MLASKHESWVFDIATLLKEYQRTQDTSENESESSSSGEDEADSRQPNIKKMQ